jgi:hypothetical protein
MTHALEPARLRHLLARDGGFTLALPHGRPVRRGLAVCVDRRRSRWFPWAAWDDDVVRDWTSGHHAGVLGGWLHDGAVWLDVVRVVPSALAPLALAAARRAGQRAAYDLGRRRLVPCGRRR